MPGPKLSEELFSTHHKELSPKKTKFRSPGQAAAPPPCAAGALRAGGAAQSPQPGGSVRGAHARGHTCPAAPRLRHLPGERGETCGSRGLRARPHIALGKLRPGRQPRGRARCGKAGAERSSAVPPPGPGPAAGPGPQRPPARGPRATPGATRPSARPAARRSPPVPSEFSLRLPEESWWEPTHPPMGPARPADPPLSRPPTPLPLQPSSAAGRAGAMAAEPPPRSATPPPGRGLLPARGSAHGPPRPHARAGSALRLAWPGPRPRRALGRVGLCSAPRCERGRPRFRSVATRAGPGPGPGAGCWQQAARFVWFFPAW